MDKNLYVHGHLYLTRFNILSVPNPPSRSLFGQRSRKNWTRSTVLNGTRAFTSVTTNFSSSVRISCGRKQYTNLRRTNKRKRTSRPTTDKRVVARLSSHDHLPAVCAEPSFFTDSFWSRSHNGYGAKSAKRKLGESRAPHAPNIEKTMQSRLIIDRTDVSSSIAGLVEKFKSQMKVHCFDPVKPILIIGS